MTAPLSAQARPRRPVVDIGDVVAQLTAEADAIARELVPGRREGREWVALSTRQGGQWGDSLKIQLDGAERGVWAHFAGGKAGDILDLVAYVLYGGDKKRAFAWALARLGYRDGKAPDPRRVAQAKKDHARRQAKAEAERADRAKRARGLWLAGQARLAGTPAAAYLAGRGIDLDRLVYSDGHVGPRALRFHPALWHPETKRQHPGLVAAISNPAGEVCAVHRTYLEEAPGGGRGGGWRKLSGVTDAKLSWGEYAGGCIRLWNGEAPDPKTGEMKAAPRLNDLTRERIRKWAAAAAALPGENACNTVAISEGIEDGLTAACGMPERRVLAAVSGGNLGNIVLPPPIRTLYVIKQNDPPDSAADRALRQAIAAQRARGILKVMLADPPAGVKDINDAIRE